MVFNLSILQLRKLIVYAGWFRYQITIDQIWVFNFEILMQPLGNISELGKNLQMILCFSWINTIFWWFGPIWIHEWQCLGFSLFHLWGNTLVALRLEAWEQVCHCQHEPHTYSHSLSSLSSIFKIMFLSLIIFSFLWSPKNHWSYKL